MLAGVGGYHNDLHGHGTRVMGDTGKASNGGRWKWVAGILGAVALTLGSSMGATATQVYFRISDKVETHDRQLAKLEELPSMVENFRKELLEEVRGIRKELMNGRNNQVPD